MKQNSSETDPSMYGYLMYGRGESAEQRGKEGFVCKSVKKRGRCRLTDFAEQ